MLKLTADCRPAVIDTWANATSNGLGPAATMSENTGTFTNVDRRPQRRPTACASPTSRPRAKVTVVPLTAPTWKPSLGRLSPTVRTPGVIMKGAGRGRLRRGGDGRGAQRGGGRGGEGAAQAPHDVASTRTGVAHRDEVVEPLGVGASGTRTQPCDAA